jgi:hypothetical protein
MSRAVEAGRDLAGINDVAASEYHHHDERDHSASRAYVDPVHCRRQVGWAGSSPHGRTINEKPQALPRLNDDPEVGELDDDTTYAQEPDPELLAEARGERAVPTERPPRFEESVQRRTRAA